ncbi:MAG TPA: hypothetical protein VLC46_16320 [Thermoanaerobaculia bacterium]|nr:hypothetical protein [Thermoanaerobaculia bacterium]
MSEETIAVSDSLSTDSAAGAFEEMFYWITVARDKFDMPKFRDGLPASLRDRDTSEVLASPKDELRGKYHAFFAWNVQASLVQFQLTYRNGAMQHIAGETEPYAEELMKWLGGFFESATVACHIHAQFEYPLASRHSAVPISVPSDLPCGAVFSGLALRVPTSPNGVSSIKWTQGESHWYAEVVATRTINFEAFTPYEDASALSAVLDMFLARGT